MTDEHPNLSKTSQKAAHPSFSISALLSEPRASTSSLESRQQIVEASGIYQRPSLHFFLKMMSVKTDLEFACCCLFGRRNFLLEKNTKVKMNGKLEFQNEIQS